MSTLSRTHLRQGRSFLRVGDSQRAVELLEKARALARDDKQLLREVLSALSDAYSMNGQPDRAARCQEQIRFLPAPQASQAMQQFVDIVAPAHPVPRRWRGLRSAATWVAVLGITACLCIAFVLGYNKYKAHRAAQANSTSAADVLPPITVPPPPPATPTATAAAPVASTIFAAPTTQQTQIGELVQQDVGLLIILGHYQGDLHGRSYEIDLPLASGAVFAISKDGVLLTNKHVVEAANDPSIPGSLQNLGLPTFTLRKTFMKVCFGPDASDHHDVTLVTRSDQFDLAVLKIGRAFAKPMSLSFQGPVLAQDVCAVGFPGAVEDMFNSTHANDARIQKFIENLPAAGHVDAFSELFTPESYQATLTGGHISTAERHIDDVAYTQFDAKVSLSNSGGPLIDSQTGSVVAIVTPAGVGDAVSYNYGLLLQQIRNDISPYLQTTANPKGN